MASLRVKELAQERGYTMTTLKNDTGLNMSQVSSYWHDKVRAVSLDILATIAGVLGVLVSDLIANDEGRRSTTEMLDELYGVLKQKRLVTPITLTTFEENAHRITAQFKGRMRYEMIVRLAQESTQAIERDTKPTRQEANLLADEVRRALEGSLENA